MKLLIIIDETCFHHPLFVKKIIEKLDEHKIIVGIVNFIPKGSNLQYYFIKNIHKLYFIEIYRLLFGKMRSYLSIIPFYLNLIETPPFVKNLLVKNNISYFNIDSNINDEYYLEKIKGISPDIIISSNSQIFNNSLLSIANICNINRHSSLLPSYKGLLPVFHAYARGEKEIGASIHLMQEGVDDGPIIVQKKIKLDYSKSLNELYGDCFNLSADIIKEAVDIIKEYEYSNLPFYQSNCKNSYFSFPKKKEWIQFRKNGGRII